MLGLRTWSAVLLVVLAAGVGCGDDEERFIANLSGANEVPAVQTSASGTATFTLMQDGTVSFTITVSQIQNVVAAHIHDGASGVNGNVILDLFVPAQPTGSVNGTLASGTFDNSGVKQGNLGDLLDRMRARTAYVNVHTQQNGAGEIRGQIGPS